MQKIKMLMQFKDFFTVGTIICGFLVLVFASSGLFLLASSMIMLGFILDAFDGFIGRLTKSSNEFGAEFDRVADLVIYSMSPSILLFFAYKQTNLHMAIAIGIVPLLFGCIRFARFNIKKIEYPGYWIGLPRPASAIAIIGFLNASLTENSSGIYAFIFVLILGMLNISFLPYFGHHERKLSNFEKVIIGGVIILFVGSIFLNLAWDIVFVLSIFYIISPFFIPKNEKNKIKKFIRK